MCQPLYYEHRHPTSSCHRILETQELWRPWGFCSSLQEAPLYHPPPRGHLISTEMLVKSPIPWCMRLAILLFISSALSNICPKHFLHLTYNSIWQSTFSHFFFLRLGGDWILMIIYGAEYFTVLDQRPVFRQIDTRNCLRLKRNSQSTQFWWFNSIAFVILSTTCNAERWAQG